MIEKKSKKLLYILGICALSSCHIPKRLYLNNKKGKPVTLSVDSDFVTNEDTVLSAFRASLDNRKINPGHVIINFGEGSWSDAEEATLKKLLEHTVIKKDSSAESFRFPKEAKIGHGLFIPELIVNITER